MLYWHVCNKKSHQNRRKSLLFSLSYNDKAISAGCSDEISLFKKIFLSVVRLILFSIYHILYVILQMRWHQLHLQAPHSAFCAVHWSDDYRCSTIFVSFSFVAESSSLWSRIILDVIFSLSPFVYIMWTNRTRILNIRLWLITLILMLTSDCRLVAFFIMSINSVYLFRLNDEVIVISTIFRFFQTVVKKGNWNR